MTAFKSAFTLSELLIALALLGLIATFTIPKVLQAVSGQSDQTKLKEVISVIHEALIQFEQDGRPEQFGDYLASKLNVVLYCQNDSASEGCWDPVIQNRSVDDAGFICKAVFGSLIWMPTRRIVARDRFLLM